MSELLVAYLEYNGIFSHIGFDQFCKAWERFQQVRDIREIIHFRIGGKEMKREGVEEMDEKCTKCGQIDEGQYGEYPCLECGLPLLWGDKELMEEKDE